MTTESIDPELDKLVAKIKAGTGLANWEAHTKAAINAHYISRERVLEAIPKTYGTIYNLPDYEAGWNAAIDAIKKELGLLRKL